MRVCVSPQYANVHLFLICIYIVVFGHECTYMCMSIYSTLSLGGFNHFKTVSDMKQNLFANANPSLPLLHVCL